VNHLFLHYYIWTPEALTTYISWNVLHYVGACQNLYIQLFWSGLYLLKTGSNEEHSNVILRYFMGKLEWQTQIDFRGYIGCQIGIQCLSSFFIDFNFFYTVNDLFRGSNGILKWSNKWWSSILHFHFLLFSFSFYNYSILYTIKLYFFNQELPR
jgi:hypothetical protein